MPGKGQVEPAEPTAVVSPKPFQMLLRKMEQMATLDTETTINRIESSVTPILEAKTETDMWEADELTQYNAQKLSGCDLQIFGFDVKYASGDSDIKTSWKTSDGKQMYLLVEAARITNATEKRDVKLPELGEVFIWNTSAQNIVPKLFWMLNHGWFDPDSAHGPVYLHIQGTNIGGGKSVEKLKPFTGTPLVQASEVPF